MSVKEVTKHQLNTWLHRLKKVSSTSFLESALGGAQELKVQHAPIRIAGDHEVIAAGGSVASKLTQLASVVKAVLRAMLKIKSRLILACDYERKASLKCWPLRALGVNDSFHAFWPILQLHTCTLSNISRLSMKNSRSHFNKHVFDSH